MVMEAHQNHLLARQNELAVTGKAESSLFKAVRKRVLGDGQPSFSDTGRQFWMPDSRAKQCYDCGSTFNALRRRHHCRICGQVFCHRCSPHMIDAKLYKSCTGSETSGSVRVCKYCYRVTLKNEATAPVEHSGNHSAAASDRPVHAIAQKQQPQQEQLYKSDPNSSGSTLNSWFLKSTFGRRLSASASLASLGEMVRSTITPAERKPSRSRPVSASSDHDRRFSLVNTPNDGQGPYDLVNSSSYDNLRSLISEVSERIDDDYNKPNWVKEILEDAKQKQLDQLEQEQLENDIEFVVELNKLNNQDYNFLEDDEENLNGEQPDATRIKFNSNAETVSVRYSLTPTRSRDDSDQAKKPRPPPIDLSGHSFESSTGSTSETSSPYDLFRNLISGEKSFFDDLLTNSGPRLDTSDDLGASPAPEDIAFSLMEAIYDRHCNRILQQTLLDEKLSLDWLPVIADLSKRIASTIILDHHSYLSSIDNYYMDSLEMRQGLRRNTAFTIRCGNTFFPMDIRQRVKIKGIQNGSKADCTIVNGVVFTKNVAHRRMRTDIANPKILLFACSIGYDERKRALAATTSTSAILKLTSFDSMRLQEPNYVANLVAKIASMDPDVVFVMGSVSSSALELLHEKYGVTVVLNVKRQILERIAHYTGSSVIHSPEILNQTRIGTCGRFRLQKFAVSKEGHGSNGQRCAPMTKTLMFVEDCPKMFGCSVLLRGTARFFEFRQLKSVLGYMVYVQYNARLEKAFHLGLNCVPIDPSGAWKSLGEMLQHLTRNRQRMNSARSRPVLQEDALNVITEFSLQDVPDSPAIKSPEAKAVTKLTTISDNSDPLRSTQKSSATDDTVLSPAKAPKLNTIELTEIISTKCEQLLSAIPLSCSPGIEFPVPFLMDTNIHAKSSLRHYYPPNLLASERLTQLTSLEIDKRASNANEIYGSENESLDKDDDYANYVYLSNHYAEIKRDYPELTDAVARKEEAKLRPLEKLLESRYMVQKPHPLLLVNDHECTRQNGRQLVSDFRACGPYLRCIPAINPKSARNSKAVDTIDTEPVVEPLSSIDQERISVLFSVFSPQSKNAPNYCFKPHTLDIAYYGKNDMSLGAFLFRHFFFLRSRFNQPTSNSILDDSVYGSMTSSTVARRIFCSSETCNASMFRHLVRFSHHRGTITVLLNKIHDSRHVPMPHRILTWTFCVRCRAKSANSEMTADALAFSFGKFLELKFYGDRHFNYGRYFDSVSPCQHSLHKESYQFFSYDQLVVSFKYDPIVLYEVVTPAPIIATTRNQFSKQDLINYLQDLTVRGHEVYAKVGEEIDRLREAINVKTNSSHPNGATLTGALAVLNFDATDITQMDEWSARLKTEESDFVAAIKEAHIRISTFALESASVVDLFRIQNRVIRAKKSVVETVSAWNDRINEFVTARKRNPDKLITSLMNRILTSDKQQQPDQKSQGDTLSNKSLDLDKPESERLGSAAPSVSLTGSQENLLDSTSPASKLTSITSKVIARVASKATNDTGEGPVTSSFAARFLSPRTNEEAYIAIANPFESSLMARQYQMFEHYQLPTYKDVSIIVRDKDLGSIIAYALTTPEYDRKLADISIHHKPTHCKWLSSLDGTLENVDGAALSSAAKSESNDATSGLKQHITSDLAQHIDVQYNDPFAKFYCCIYFADQFRRLRSMVLADGDTSNRATIRRLLPDPSAENSTTSSAEDLYIHSLANCIPWNAIGGKSGSTFSKTQNQRFILKEVSKGELNHFITFSCDYIAYCERALLEKNPSAFVKIIGVYQISYKNSCTNKASVHHILVMENLFYECNISFIYDLKGSMRNRKVEINVAANGAQDSDVTNGEDPSTQENSLRNVHDEAKLYQSSHAQTTTVLMDENLRQISTVYPLYVHEHSKKLLMEAIYRDSEFLRTHGVMDYSLLVGFDEQFAEYVVGIIDYVRLFNWEKEIEFRVKKLGKTIDPTIVHPSQYQRRFLDAINEYFVEIPDKWRPFMHLMPLAGTQIPSQSSPEYKPVNGNSEPSTSNFTDLKQALNDDVI